MAANSALDGGNQANRIRMTAAGTASDTRRVALAIEDGLARLRLSRPDARNAIDPAMVAALDEAATACAEDSSVRALLISAQGPAFTVGGDLRHFGSRADDLDVALEEMIPTYHRALARLAALEVPVVCAVQGAIAGGGLGLAWAADLVLAADDARFATAFAKIGLSGDGGSSWYLPRLVGLRRAQELLIEGRVLSAEEALEWGIVTRLVPLGQLEAEAEELARRLAAGPTVALAHMRRLLRGSSHATLEDGLEAERAAMKACGATADGREGVRAFVEGRSPRFKGREQGG